MKKMFIVIVSGLSLLFSASLLAAGVGVVDMEKVVTDSPQAKKIKADMEKKFGPQKKQIMDLGASLQANVKKFQKDKAVMSQKDLDALQKKMSSEQSQLQSMQGKVQQQLVEEQNKKMDEFMGDVKAAAKKVADKDDLDLVLPANAVIYSGDDSDITQKVMDAM
jgi:outer membrane protein